MSTKQRQEMTRKILESSGTLIKNDHFVYASGDHGSGWVAKDLINLRPELAHRLGQLLAEEVQAQGFRPDLICGPAIVGVICAQYVALALKARCVFAERLVGEGGKTEKFEIKRGYDEMIRAQSVLIVDDVVNTGFSVRLTCEAVVQSGGHPMGIAAYVNRGNVGAVDLGVEVFIYLDEVLLPSWPADECPLCKAGVPVNVRYAHGSEFVASEQAHGMS